MKNILLEPDELRTLICECLRDEFKNFSLAPSPKDQGDLVTTAEATKLLRVSKVTLSKWRTEGKIKFYRIGTRIRFRKSELLDALTAPKKYGRKNMDTTKEEVKS